MQQDFYDKLLSGEIDHCERCGRYAQIYKRHKLGGINSFIHISRLIPPGNTGTGDFTKAKYWGLIEEEVSSGGEKSGGWRLTQDGVSFVENSLYIQEWAYIYDDKVLRFDGGMIGIDQAIKSKFSYTELMAGI